MATTSGPAWLTGLEVPSGGGAIENVFWFDNEDSFEPIWTAVSYVEQHLDTLSEPLHLPSDVLQPLDTFFDTDSWQTALSKLQQQLDTFFNTEPLHTALANLHQQLDTFFETEPLHTLLSDLGLDWHSH